MSPNKSESVLLAAIERYIDVHDFDGYEKRARTVIEAGISGLRRQHSDPSVPDAIDILLGDLGLKQWQFEERDEHMF